MPIYSIPPEVHGGRHHGNLHSPIGIGPRGNSVFFCSSYVDNGNDTYTAPKSSFVSTRDSGMYDPRTGDLVLFRVEHDDDSSLLIGYIFSINPIGGAITFVKLAEISTSGFSPSIEVSDITGGHRVTVTNSGGSSTFDVMDGEKGDPFEFEDFTEEQLAGLREDVASVYTSKDEAVVTTVGTNTTSITIPFADWSGSRDMLLVYVEGLALTEGVDYVISGSSINLTSPIIHEGTDVTFKRMTTIALDPGDLGDLVDNVANRIESLITSGDLDATTSTSGTMSADDKTKLDGIATGATKVSVTQTTYGSGASVVNFSVQRANGSYDMTPSAVKADSNGYIEMSSIANGSIPNSKLATPYSLPIATTSTIGGMKPDGTTVTVDNDGTIHAAEQYTLPTMSSNTKGGAMVGDGLAMTGDALGIGDGGVDMDMLSQEVQEAIAEGGSGYNPSLSVGRADALTGADSTAQWATRESTGTGSAIVRSVQGAAVVWNQLCVNGNFEQKANWTEQNASYTVSNNVATMLATAANGRIYATVSKALKSGTKLLYLCELNPTSACRVLVGSWYSNAYRGEFNITPGWQRVAHIATFASDVSSQPFAITDTRESGWDAIQIRNAMAFDLTAIFGAGNEPSTIAEFEAMYPEAYYPYSAPILKPVQIAGIQSKDAQGNALDSVEWTAQTLWGAGAIGDMLYSDHVETRVGVVDLGTLTWTYNSELNCFAAAIAPMFPAAKVEFHGTCLEYPFVGIYQNRVNKSSFFIYNTYAGIQDTSFNGDVNACKAALDGVLLYYELATPTTTPISPALALTYRVEQGGIESIIVPDGEISAPPVLTVAEGESAADVVMDALACIATPDGPTATANHSVGTYLTMGGKLYKVTSAIAVGETIAAGTNVSQTTVMAELIALTQ